MAVRPRFDPKRSLVAARDFTFMGRDYKPGDPFAPEGASDRMRARQYEARAVNFGEDTADSSDAEPVQMTGPKGGRYTITAPWLDEPEVVRGKANAEKRLAELRAEGAPLGFIEGGSAVTVEGGEGGWYEVNAPWLDEPEKVQGREAAEARQRELHDAGEPDTDGGEGVQTEGGDPQKQEANVVDENEKKPEDGDKPNEPGTNQPNGAEVINDQKVADGTAAEENGEGDGEGGDGTTGTVGP